MKKNLAIFLFSLFLLLNFSTPVSAKRLLPRVKPKGTNVSSSKGITTLVKFRGDRLAINVTFSNLNIASSVSYSLSYNTRGTTQGAAGTLNPTTSTDPTVRELLFGTCSHGVCRYDSGITNARFVVTTRTINGKKVIKSFRLKV
jgi:hypothetical protein